VPSVLARTHTAVPADCRRMRRWRRLARCRCVAAAEELRALRAGISAAAGRRRCRYRQRSLRASCFTATCRVRTPGFAHRFERAAVNIMGFFAHGVLRWRVALRVSA